jgi:two-component sensor histidine kinase
VLQIHSALGGGEILSTSNLTVETSLRSGDEHAPSPSAELSGDGETELSASRQREKELLSELSALAQQQDLMAQEFEHRLGNSLQMIVSLLTLQSLAAGTPEAAAQLAIAAGRVAAFGRVHRRLHLHDRQKTVAFKSYLQGLCGDLFDLMLQTNGGRSIVVTGTDVVLPTAFGVPLGFLVSEAITNAVKYGQGNIAVSIDLSSDVVLLSISDDGPGFPPEPDPKNRKGLGMRLIHSLAKQIGGKVEFAPGSESRGARLMVTFSPRAQI